MFHNEQIPKEWQLFGDSFLLLGRADQANYCLLLLSNHLQIKWQTTPAMTATKNDAMYSIPNPLSVTSIGAVTIRL